VVSGLNRLGSPVKPRGAIYYKKKKVRGARKKKAPGKEREDLISNRTRYSKRVGKKKGGHKEITRPGNRLCLTAHTVDWGQKGRGTPEGKMPTEKNARMKRRGILFASVKRK